MASLNSVVVGGTPRAECDGGCFVDASLGVDALLSRRGVAPTVLAKLNFACALRLPCIRQTKPLMPCV